MFGLQKQIKVVTPNASNYLIKYIIQWLELIKSQIRPKYCNREKRNPRVLKFGVVVSSLGVGGLGRARLSEAI